MKETQPHHRTNGPLREVGTKEAQHHRRGIYILPNLFTTAGLFSGFYAIVQAMNGDFVLAPLAIFIAVLMDGLDGRIARWTHTQSDFGAEYDSLADMVSFGLAPALLMYGWVLSNFGKAGWLTAFIYTAAVAFRLARFNTQLNNGDKRFFQGLPSPSGAMFLATYIWVLQIEGVKLEFFTSYAALLITLIIAILMVSNINYRSFKDLRLHERVPFVTILVVPLIFVLIFLDPPIVLFLIFLAYVLSGPVSAGIRLVRRPAKRQENTD